MSRPDVAEPDMVAELCELLRAANARPYIDTYYMSPEQRVRAFRMRASAFLTSRRAPFRHRGPDAAPATPKRGRRWVVAYFEPAAYSVALDAGRRIVRAALDSRPRVA